MAKAALRFKHIFIGTFFRRITIGTVAAGIVWAAGGLAPDLYLARAHFRPDAHRAAAAILESEFGRAAVERGILSVAPLKIPVPVRGSAIVPLNSVSLTIAFIAIRRDRAQIIRLDGYGVEATCRVATVERGARQMWAVLRYLDAVGGQAADWSLMVTPTLHQITQPVYFSGVSAEREGLTDAGGNMFPYGGPMSAQEALRQLLWSRYLADLEAAGVIAWSSDPARVAATLRDALRRASPPRSHADCHTVARLSDPFTHMDEQAALEALKGLRSAGTPRWPQRLYWVPVLGPYARRANDLRSQLAYVSDCRSAQITLLMNLAELPHEERISYLTDRVGIDYLCEEFFARAYPLEWRQCVTRLLATNDAEWYSGREASYRELLAGDEQLARAVSSYRPLERAQVYADHILAEHFADRDAVARLFETAFTPPDEDGPRLHAPAVLALLDLHRKGIAVGDLESVVRLALGRIAEWRTSNWSRGRPSEIAEFVDGACDAGEGCVRLLHDLAMDTSALSHACRGLAIDVLSRRGAPNGADFLFDVLEVERAAGQVSGNVVDALIRLGDDRAAEAVEALAAECGATLDAAPPEGVSPEARRTRLARHALARMRAIRAPDRIAFYLSLDRNDRIAVYDDLPDLLPEEELRELLAAAGCAETRSEAFSQLLRIRQNLLYPGSIR